MDIWLYLTIVALVMGALDILSTIVGLGLKARYPDYVSDKLIKEQNKLLSSFLDDGSWQSMLFGYTLISEQKLIYILGAHLLIIYVSEYLCVFLCIFIGLYMTFAFLNVCATILAVQTIRTRLAMDKTISDLAEIFESSVDANSGHALEDDKKIVARLWSATKEGFDDK